MSNKKRIAVIYIGRGFGSTMFYIWKLGPNAKTTKTTPCVEVACHIPRGKMDKVKAIYQKSNIPNSELKFELVDW